MAVAPSKTFNLASMKAAAVIVPDRKLGDRFQQVLSLSHGDNMNMLGLHAYIAAYEEGDEYLDQLLVYLAGNVAAGRWRWSPGNWRTFSPGRRALP